MHDLRRYGAATALFAVFTLGMTKEATLPSFEPPAPVARNADRFFVSGHSLTDRPLPDMLEEMAAQSGRSLTWNRQHIGGSSIRQRSRGGDGSPPGSGYTAGVDRAGNPIDVLAEFAASATRQYDVLIITEWHRVLDALLWEDTVASLGDFQDRFIAANPDGLTYFFAPWASLSDPADPGDWIDYERSASPMWQCLVANLNRDRARRSRDDRILFIPASLALADVVERLTSGEAISGFEGMAAEAVVAQLFSDRVHLTELGSYYVAVVTYASVFGDEAAAAAPPPSLDRTRAEALRAIALSFLDQWRSRQAIAPARDCDGVPARFILAYTRYMERTYSRPEMGYVAAQAKRVRDTARFFWKLRPGAPVLAPTPPTEAASL